MIPEAPPSDATKFTASPAAPAATTPAAAPETAA